MPACGSAVGLRDDGSYITTYLLEAIASATGRGEEEESAKHTCRICGGWSQAEDVFPGTTKAGWSQANSIQPVPNCRGYPGSSPGNEPLENPHLRWHPLRGEWVATLVTVRGAFMPPHRYNPLAPTKTLSFRRNFLRDDMT